MSLGSHINGIQSAIWHWPVPILIKEFIMFMLELCFNLLFTFNKNALATQDRINKYIQDARRANQVEVSPRIALITGANCGLGYETAKAVGRAGYHVIMACRNREATKAAIARLKQETGLGDDAFEFIQLDLSSFRSIDAFVREIKVKGLPINLLIANAGIMMLPKYTETEDGVEMQFGVNHLGHFHLITSLLDVIKKSVPARIVIVSSTAHLMANKIDYNRIFDKSKYNSDANYCISKLANVMFSNALAKRLVGSHVTVNSLHPGVVSTSLVRHLPMQSVLNLIMRLVFLSSLDGASTSIYLALSSDIAHISGEYWARETTQEPNPNALREDEQEKLWRLSEKLIAEIEARLNQGHAK